MRFHVAWDSIEKENRNLKALCAVALLLATTLAVALARASSRPPLVVERGCLSRAAELAPEPPTDAEMAAFAAEALRARFNTRPEGLDLLSPRQRGFREVEQREMQRQKMRQTVLVQSVRLDKDGAVVDADRVIAVGEVRSTLRFPLRARLERTARTEANPYGLQLSEVEPSAAAGGSK